MLTKDLVKEFCLVSGEIHPSSHVSARHFRSLTRDDEVENVSDLIAHRAGV